MEQKRSMPFFYPFNDWTLYEEACYTVRVNEGNFKWLMKTVHINMDELCSSVSKGEGYYVKQTTKSQ